jgi:nitronate monooxygenase
LSISPRGYEPLLDVAFGHRIRLIASALGPPPPALIERAHDSDVLVVALAGSKTHAERHQAAGVDLIVAQGTEAGGHGARRGWSTLPFVPVVVDLVAPVPVLAAGGIADGRGVAAALSLGAAGALVGTRFLATAESLTDPAAKKAVIDADGEHTERSSVLDIARGSDWPREYTGRTLAHPFLDQWRDREDELAASPAARSDYEDGVTAGAFPPQPVWAGQAVDLITDLPSAAEVVAWLSAGAEDALARALGR